MTEKEYYKQIRYELGQNPFTKKGIKEKFDKYLKSVEKLIKEYAKDHDTMDFVELSKMLLSSYPDKDIYSENMPFTIHTVQALMFLHYPKFEDVEQFIKDAAEWNEKLARIKKGEKIELDFFNQPRVPVVVISDIIRDILRYVDFVVNKFSDCERKNPELCKRFQAVAQDFFENFYKNFGDGKKDPISLLPKFIHDFFIATKNAPENLVPFSNCLSNWLKEECITQSEKQVSLNVEKATTTVAIFWLYISEKLRNDWLQMSGETAKDIDQENIIHDGDSLTIIGGEDESEDE